MSSILQKNLISTKDAATYSGYNADYISRLCRSKKIRSVQVGRAWLVEKDSLDAFLLEQGKNNAARAVMLAEEREAAYRKAQSIPEQVKKGVEPVVLRAAGVVKTLGTRVTISPLVRMHVTALATALLVVGFGAYAAQGDTLPALLEKGAVVLRESSVGARSIAANWNEQISEKMRVPETAAADASLRMFATASSSAVRADVKNISFGDPLDAITRGSSGLFSYTSGTRFTIPNFAEPSSLLSDHVLASLKKNTNASNGYHAFVTGATNAIGDLAARPEDIPSKIISAAGAAPFTLGKIVTDEGKKITAASVGLFNYVGDVSLSLGVTMRDGVVRAPYTLYDADVSLGTAVVNGSHLVLDSYTRGIYAWVNGTPRVVATLAHGIFVTGDTLSRFAEVPLPLLGHAYVKTAYALADALPAIPEAVTSAQLALGSSLISMSDTVFTTHAYLADVAGKGLYEGVTFISGRSGMFGSALHAARVALEDAALGIAGHVAVGAHASADAFSRFTLRTLAPLTPLVRTTGNGLAAVTAAVVPSTARTAAENTALFTYQTLHGLFESATDALATLWSPTATYVMPKIPAPTHPAVATGTTTPSRAVTISYPTYTSVVQGVSQAYVDGALSGLRSDLLSQMGRMIQPVANQVATNITTIQQVNMIQELTDLILHRPVIDLASISGSNFLSGKNVESEHGVFGDLSSGVATLATTTINGALSVSGDTALAGNFTVDGDGIVYSKATRSFGVGTSTPAATFAVAGNAYFSGDISNVANVNATGTLSVGGSSSLGSYAVAGYFTATSSQATSTFAGAVAIGTSTPFGNGLFTVGINSPLLYVDRGTGRIGFGTTSPSAQIGILQQENGLPIFDVYRATDAAPSGDFIAYRSNAGVPLFRVDNSGNLYAGGIINSGSQTITSASTPQLRIQNNPTDELTVAVALGGRATFGVNGTGAGINFTAGTDVVNAYAFTNAASSPILSIDTLHGRVGLGTTTPAVSFDIYAKDALRLPVGATSDQPLVGDVGYVRYNTTTHQFEGYGDNHVWQGLGGVINAAQTTYITASDANYLHFVTSSGERMTISDIGNIGFGTTSPYARLSLAGYAGDATNLFEISTSTGSGTTTALTINRNGDLSLLNGSNLTVTGNLTVSGTTNFSSTFTPNVGSNIILAANATGQIVGTSTPSAANYLATSTIATSTFSGGFAAGNNAAFVVNQIAPANALYISGSGSIGIGTQTPNASAVFDITSTTGGLLTPRLSTIQKNAIAAPAAGLVLYDSTLNKLNVFNGTSWKNVGSTEISGEVTNGLKGSVLFVGDGNVLGQDTANFNYATSTGRFGLGTSTPFARLSIAGYANDTANLFAISTSTSAFSTSTALTVDRNGSLALLNGASLSVSGDINTTGKYRINGTQVVYLPNQTNFPGSFFLGTGGNNLSHASAQQGWYNTGVGISALSANTTGSYNTALGQLALTNNLNGANNTGVGASALYNLTSGGNNIALGGNALYNTTDSSDNVAIGLSAMYQNIHGGSNTAIGNSALYNDDNGSYSVAVGYAAGYGTIAQTHSDFNTFLGSFADYSNTTGDYNTIIGAHAGYGITSGARNIVIGAYVDAPSPTTAAQLNIGNLIYGSGVYNGYTHTGVPVMGGKIGIGTSTLASTFNVDGTSLLFGQTNTQSVVPIKNALYDLGAPASYWNNAYINNITANNLFAVGSTTISSTNSQSFTINAQNPTLDTQNMSLVFYRGSGAAQNAVIAWDATQKRFNFNEDTYIQDEGDTPGSPTLTLQASSGQTGPLTSWLNAAGTTVSVMTSDGFLGIGTTTPWARLSADTSNLTAGVPSFVVGSSTRTDFVVTQAGNVGIGTTSPAAALDIQNATLTMLLGADNAGTTRTNYTTKNTRIASYPYVNTDTPFAILTSSSNGTDNTVSIGGNTSLLDAATVIRFFTANATTTLTGTERMRIDRNGLVGIGTTTPYAALSVSTTTANYTGQTLLSVANSSNATLFNVLGNGSVGIGTTNPQYKLEVNGTASTTQLNVGSGGMYFAAGGFMTGGSNGPVIYSQDISLAGRFYNGNVTLNGALNIKNDADTVYNMVVQDTGNVGIGMTPGATNKLDVAGFVNTDQYSGYKQNGNIAVYASTTGSVILGSAAATSLLTSSSTLTNNIAIGSAALSSANLGNWNVSGGVNGGTNNVAIGANALKKNTTGVYGVAIGTNALTSNTTGNDNNAIGMNAMNQNTTGYDNFGFGWQSMFYNTTGYNNVAIGTNALLYNVSATSTTAVGVYAGQGSTYYSNQGGTYVGQQAAYNIGNNSDYNTLIGYRAGYNITSGAHNTMLGYFSGTAGVSTGSYNILIGDDVRSGLVVGNSNQLNIGNLIFATGVTSGATASTGNVGIGTTSPYANLSVMAGGNYASQAASTVFAIGSSTAGTATSTLFSVLSNGNVGVGTAAPAYPLAVSGSIASQVTNAVAQFTAYSPAANYPRAQYLIGNTTSDTNVGMTIAPFFSSNSQLKPVIITLSNDKTSSDVNARQLSIGVGFTVVGQQVGMITSVSTDGVDTSAAGYPLIFSTQNSFTPALYIGNTAAQLVGIGTTTPGSNLSVVSGLSVGANYGVAAPSNGAIIQGNVGIGTTSPLSASKLSVSESGGSTFALALGNRNNTRAWGFAVDVNAVDDGLFSIVDTNINANRLVINTSGNVGIGTANPRVPLNTVVSANSESMALGTPSGGFMIGNAPNNLYGILAGVGGSGNGWIQVGRVDGTATAYNLSLQASGGNVGIGVTAPSQKLEIGGVAGPQMKLTSSSDANYQASLIVNYNSAHQMSLTGAGNTEILGEYAGNTALMNGNVGIGTANPLQKLQIDTGVNSTNQGIPATTGSTQNGILRLSPGTAAYGESFDFGMNVGANSYAWIQPTNRANLAVNYNLALNPNGGNVGIGTASPGNYKLNVNGVISGASYFTSYTADGLFGAAALPSIITTPGGTDRGVLFGYIDNGGGQYSPRIGFLQPTGSGLTAAKASIGLEVNGKLSIGAGASNATAMTIDQNGNVGIGTASPTQAKLVVNGNSALLANGQAQFYATDNSNYAYIANSSADTSHTNLGFYVTGSTPNVIINNLGNVGIGTVSPYTLEHLNGGVLTITNGNPNTYATRANAIALGQAGQSAGNYTSYISYSTSGSASASNSLNFELSDSSATGHTNVMTMLGNGNVGIGTTTPSDKLVAYGSSGATRIRTESSDVIGYSVLSMKGSAREWQNFVAGGSETFYGVANKYSIYDVTADRIRMVIDTNGNVGIGTTNPSYKLSLQTDPTGTGQFNAIGITRNDGVVTQNWVMAMPGSSSRDLVFSDGSNNNLYLKNGGNVGIGTTNPTYTFDLQTSQVYSAGSGIFHLKNTATGGNNYTYMLMEEADTPAVGYWTLGGHNVSNVDLRDTLAMGTQNAYPLKFVTNDAARLTILSGGNVGIGTTSPAALLDINGIAAMNGNVGTLVNIDGAGQSGRVVGSGVNIAFRGSNDLDYYGAVGGYSNAANTSGPGMGIWANTHTGAPQVYVNSTGNVGIGTANPTTALEVVGDITSKGTNWTLRTGAANNSWYSVTYGNGLFVAVAYSGTGNRVMTSPDGINWTSRTSAADNSWNSVTYGNGLFVAVAGSGTGNRVMTSPDGITWTLRTSAADNTWYSVTYGNGLFVAVSQDGTGNRVMTSPDGITWTSRTGAVDNLWYSVTYGNGLFVAVGQSGNNDRVMTSPDGITWTSRTDPGNVYPWRSVTYGNGLFVAVASSGTGNRVMTSPDGINWTARTSAADNNWDSVTYGNGLFVAVAYSGTGNRVMTSPDGITWTSRTSAADSNWFGVTYGNGLFVAVSNISNRVMTSGKAELNALASNNLYQGGMNIMGNVGIGTTSPTSTFAVTGSACISGGAGSTVACPTTAGTISARVHTTANVDLAENYFGNAAILTPGSIVSLDPSGGFNLVKAGVSTGPVLGVISTAPGVLLGGANSAFQGVNSLPVALSGRIPVTVSNENGSIAVGDRLILSATQPGIAVRAVHSGQSIGIALAPWNGTGQGSVEMFASNQYWFAPTDFSIDGSTGSVTIGAAPAAPTGAKLTVSGNVFAGEFDVAQTTAVGFTFGSTTLVAQIPAAVLTAAGTVDLYKLATYNLSGVQALSNALVAQGTRMDSLEARIAKLENGSITVASGSPISFSTSTLASALNSFGVLIQNGIAQFNSLVFRQLIASKDADGTSSAGTVTMLTGNTVAQVNNSLVAPSTKVFVTFNAALTGSWYVSDKADGSFRVILSSPQATDVSFDYFLVQTEGQLAAGAASGVVGTGGPSVSQSNGPDYTSPVITVLGDNPVHISVDGVYAEPGVHVTDNADGTDPVTTFIDGVEREVNASTISTGSPTTYIITYRSMDKAGNVATATRSVIVGNPDGTVSVGGNPSTGSGQAGGSEQGAGGSQNGNADNSQQSTENSGANTDKTAPVVTLTGAAAIELAAGDTFTDPGATALDDTDPSNTSGQATDLTSKIVVTGTVDTTTAGLYTLTYTATDAAGNSGHVSRTVSVVTAAITPNTTTASTTPAQ